MKTGETKAEVKFGKDESLIASIYGNRISREVKQEQSKAETEAKAEASQEAPNVGATAG